ncbi:hypothetical protein K474DRAFT_1701162 [Panus rudis PR-1116 ss-1]|nr:hypothetical protein K474DRAFT_1701162 [Panus rudis PR-1116 ss-1]
MLNSPSSATSESSELINPSLSHFVDNSPSDLGAIPLDIVDDPPMGPVAGYDPWPSSPVRQEPVATKLKLPWGYLRPHSRHDVPGDPLGLAFYVAYEEQAFYPSELGAFTYFYLDTRYRGDLTLMPITQRDILDRLPKTLAEARITLNSLVLELHGWQPNKPPHDMETNSISDYLITPYYDHPWRHSETVGPLCMLDTTLKFYEDREYMSLWHDDAKRRILDMYYFDVSPLFTAVKPLPIEIYELIIEYGLTYDNVMYDAWCNITKECTY